MVFEQLPFSVRNRLSEAGGSFALEVYQLRPGAVALVLQPVGEDEAGGVVVGVFGYGMEEWLAAGDLPEVGIDRQRRGRDPLCLFLSITHCNLLEIKVLRSKAHRKRG